MGKLLSDVIPEEALLAMAFGNKGGGGGTLITKTITKNGTYDPKDDGADGYSRVIVDVKNDTDVPVLNLENIYSQNDVNDISATFTARQTSAYMVILTIESESTLPNISQCFVKVNGESQYVFDYYVNSGYGFVSKCAVLNLHEGDEISARLKSIVGIYGVSASIMLVRLSSSIGNFSLKADDFTNTPDGDPEAALTVESAGFYLLFFFNRFNGIGEFKELTKNGEAITQNIIICSQGSSGWQVSHGMCILYADPLDALKVKTGFNGYVDACGIMSLKKV